MPALALGPGTLGDGVVVGPAFAAGGAPFGSGTGGTALSTTEDDENVSPSRLP